MIYIIGYISAGNDGIETDTGAILRARGIRYYRNTAQPYGAGSEMHQ